MSSFEFNKLAAGVLVALIVWMVTGIVAEELVPSEKPAKDAYPIVAAASPAASQEAAAPAAAEKPAPIPADLLAKADATAGEAIAKKCGACHTFDKGGPKAASAAASISAGSVCRAARARCCTISASTPIAATFWRPTLP